MFHIKHEENLIIILYKDIWEIMVLRISLLLIEL